MSITVESFEELIHKKGADEAVFLGCGPSINDLTEEDWEKLKSRDLWTSNNWFVHKTIVPDFYHVEIKAHRNGSMFKKIADEKHKQYKDVSWIVDQTRPYILKFLDPELYSDISVYPKVYRKKEDGKYKPDPSHVTVSCNASMTLILDLMSRMGYKKIYFVGVDLYSSEYFWSNNNDYKDVYIPEIMNSAKPDERPIDSLHPVSHLTNYVGEFCDFNEIEAINLSPKSLFAECMTTMKISDLE